MCSSSIAVRRRTAYGARAAQLLEFDQNGAFSSRDRQEPLRLVPTPITVRVDRQDNIWIADKGSDMVVKFTPRAGL